MQAARLYLGEGCVSPRVTHLLTDILGDRTPFLVKLTQEPSRPINLDTTTQAVGNVRRDVAVIGVLPRLIQQVPRQC